MGGPRLSGAHAKASTANNGLDSHLGGENRGRVGGHRAHVVVVASYNQLARSQTLCKLRRRRTGAPEPPRPRSPGHTTALAHRTAELRMITTWTIEELPDFAGP